MEMKFLEGQKSGKYRNPKACNNMKCSETRNHGLHLQAAILEWHHTDIPTALLSLDIVHIAAAAPLALPGEEPPTAHRHALISSCLS